MPKATDQTLLSPLSACSQAQNGTMSVAAWVCHLPDVHPFFVDMAQTLDRTIARLERRLSGLHAEAARLQAALGADGDSAQKPAARTKLAAYQEEVADYQGTIRHCRSQFEAQVARRWTPAEIAHAKSLAGTSSGELAIPA